MYTDQNVMANVETVQFLFNKKYLNGYDVLCFIYI